MPGFAWLFNRIGAARSFARPHTPRVDRITEPNPGAATVVEPRNMVARLDCRVELTSRETICVPSTPAGQPGGPSYGLLSSAEVKLRFANNAYDSITQIYSIDVTVENLLPEPIGTPDGATQTGLKVFVHRETAVTAYNEPGQTGSATLRNPDGTGYFTNPDQPYFAYDTILATNDTSFAKRWEWTVSPTVKSFSFAVMVEADLPSEVLVGGSPPDSVPGWIYADSNVVSGYPYIAGEVAKDIVVVLFKPYTTQPKRKAAVDSVSGTVVGGIRLANGDGAYYVQVPGDGTAGPANAAVKKLKKLSQVSYVTEEFVDAAYTASLRPSDGTAFRDWRLYADSADGHNWALEAISAPLAWGCSVGDSTVRIAVVDHDFHSAGDLTANVTGGVPGWDQFSGAADTVDHGTKVASLVGARGANAAGITGVMWRSDLRLYDAMIQANDHVDYGPTGNPLPMALIIQMIDAGREGARVVNLSWGIDWWKLVAPGYDPATETNVAVDSANRDRTLRARDALNSVIQQLQTSSPSRTPLFVVAAGNNNTDAYWSGFPRARETYPRQVLVVAAAAHSGPGAFAKASFSNTNADVIAPGDAVYSLNRLGDASPVPASGTSFAAPLVTGIAGLLMSFDGRLSADTVKTLIERGANLSRRTAGGMRMVDAYQSLRLAAARRTAPLCGNPVFQDTLGNVHVRRDTLWMVGADTVSSRLETLFTTTDSLPEVLHGGKRLRFSSTNGREWTLTGTAFSWAARTAMADTVANATLRSRDGLSHGRPLHPDSTVTVAKTRISTTQERFDVAVNGVVIASIDGPLAQRAQNRQTYCYYWPTAEGTSGCYPGQFWTTYQDSLVTNATVGFAPMGDTVVLAISRDSVGSFIEPLVLIGSDSWKPHGLDRKTLPTMVYHISIRTGNHRSWELAGRAEKVGISEDGRNLALQVRNKHSFTTYTEPGVVTTAQANLCTGVFAHANSTVIFRTPARNLTFFGWTTPCYPSSAFGP